MDDRNSFVSSQEESEVTDEQVFVAPKSVFVEPELVSHGDVARVTAGHSWSGV